MQAGENGLQRNRTSVQEVNRLLKQFDEMKKDDEANDQHVKRKEKGL